MSTELLPLDKNYLMSFLLNGKKGNCLELSNDVNERRKSDFKKILIFKDKNMQIHFSYLSENYNGENILIQQFEIYSNWWGRIKNSFFTIDGEKGKVPNKEKRLGVININELEEISFRKKVPLKKSFPNKKSGSSSFADLVAYCQNNYKFSPSYKVVKQISLPPASIVEIEITMHNGSYLIQGASKKDAANNFAKEYFKDI